MLERAARFFDKKKEVDSETEVDIEPEDAQTLVRALHKLRWQKGTLQIQISELQAAKKAIPKELETEFAGIVANIAKTIEKQKIQASGYQPPTFDQVGLQSDGLLKPAIKAGM